jgi:hypothetical protein
MIPRNQRDEDAAPPFRVRADADVLRLDPSLKSREEGSNAGFGYPIERWLGPKKIGDGEISLLGENLHPQGTLAVGRKRQIRNESIE